METPVQPFLDLIRKQPRFRLFLLQQLPAAYFAGLRLEAVQAGSCTASVPYKWFNRNPFRSTYFACLAMAAEMSTGILAMAAIYRRKPAVSMLITGMESRYHKKAVGKTYFTCRDGAVLQEAAEASVRTGTGQEVRVYSRGENSEGALVAEFWLTWSFKPKST